jgi:hypothetical protein
MPLLIYRGDTYRWRFKLWLDTERTVPADLNGAKVVAQIRDRGGGSFIAGMACTINVPNTVVMVLAAHDSAKLPSSSVWDLQVTYAWGDVATVLAGQVNTTSDVTTVLT